MADFDAATFEVNMQDILQIVWKKQFQQKLTLPSHKLILVRSICMKEKSTSHLLKEKHNGQ